MPGGGSYPRGKWPVISAPVDASVQRENAGYIAPGQSALMFNLDNVPLTASTQTVPLYTVPANKTFLITDIFMSHTDVTALRFALTVTIGSQTITKYSVPAKGDTAPVEQAGQETQIDVPAGATLNIVVPADATKNAYVNIAGVLQPIGVG